MEPPELLKLVRSWKEAEKNKMTQLQDAMQSKQDVMKKEVRWVNWKLEQERGGAPMVDGRHIFSSLTNSVGVYIPINKDSYLRWDKFIPNI